MKDNAKMNKQLKEIEDIELQCSFGMFTIAHCIFSDATFGFYEFCGSLAFEVALVYSCAVEQWPSLKGLHSVIMALRLLTISFRLGADGWSKKLSAV